MVEKKKKGQLERSLSALLSLSPSSFKSRILPIFFFFFAGQNQKVRHFRWRVVNTLFSFPLLGIYQVHRIVCACARACAWVCETVSRFSKRGMKMHGEREVEKKISFRSERKSGAKNSEENSPGEIVSFYSLAEGRGKKGSPPIK